MAGAYRVGGMHSREHAWCPGSMHGRGVCMVGGMHDGGVHGRVCVWKGRHTWQTMFITRLGCAVVTHSPMGWVWLLGHMWDVFHPSQPMPGGFPHGVFFHPQKGSKFFSFEPALKSISSWLGTYMKILLSSRRYSSYWNAILARDHFDKTPIYTHFHGPSCRMSGHI